MVGLPRPYYDLSAVGWSPVSLIAPGELINYCMRGGGGFFTLFSLFSIQLLRSPSLSLLPSLLVLYLPGSSACLREDS